MNQQRACAFSELYRRTGQNAADYDRRFQFIYSTAGASGAHNNAANKITVLKQLDRIGDTNIARSTVRTSGLF